MYVKQWQFISLTNRETQKYRKKPLPDPYEYEKERDMFMQMVEKS